MNLENAKRIGRVRWYDEMAGHCWNEEHLQDETKRGKALEAWSTLINKLLYERRLVLYAQRHWLSLWFPQFDPTRPDQIEDTDRPWDWDHIFPTKYIYYCICPGYFVYQGSFLCGLLAYVRLPEPSLLVLR